MCANIDEYTHMHVKIYISVKMYKWDYKLQWTKPCGADDRKESTKLSREAVDEHEFHYHSHSAWWTSQYPTNATAGHDWQKEHKFLPKQMKCIDWKSIIFPTMTHLFASQKPK